MITENPDLDRKTRGLTKQIGDFLVALEGHDDGTLVAALIEATAICLKIRGENNPRLYMSLVLTSLGLFAANSASLAEHPAMTTSLENLSKLMIEALLKFDEGMVQH